MTEVPRILLAGADSSLVSELALRLAGVSIHHAVSPDAIFDHLRSADLLVIDHRFSARTVDLLAELRAATPDLRVIHCLDPTADARLVRRLILDLGVTELLFHPVSSETLARRVATVLGVAYSGRPGPAPGPVSEDALTRKLGEAWSRVRSKMFARVEVLEQAGKAWLEGELTPGLRQQAEREAHNLAGSLGTFGLSAGTRFGLELERALAGENPESELPKLRFLEVVAALRLEVERSPDLQYTGEGAAKAREFRPALLVSPDPELAVRLTEEAIARRWPWESVPDFGAARRAIAELNPTAVLMDVDTGIDGTLEFLSELAARTPPVIAIMLTSSGSLMDRVEVARRGGRGFFLKSLPAAEIVETAEALLNRLRAGADVLAVDDDPAVLDALGAILGSRGIRLKGLSDPLAFWEKLEGSPPDLLLLDIDMPQVSGIELCRVVRNDPRWAAIPVVFLTALSDAETVRLVFASGADDFVAKPIVGPELVTRISNRLERTRLLRSVTEVDTLTQLPNRLKSRHTFADFLRLADRHGQPMGVALLAVDGLGYVNEKYGSGAGDEVLRRLGRCLREEFHSEEVAGRWGGNEFAVGLYGLDRQASRRRLRDLAHGFAQFAFPIPAVSATPSEISLTLSGGVAGYPEDGSDLDALLLAAGEARRRAAAAGGNQLLSGISGHPGPALIDLAIITSDDATASLLVHAFEPDGYSSRILRSSLTAARALCGADRSLQARVVLIDASLPELDSVGFIRQLADEGTLGRTCAILLSSPSVRDDVVQALQLGAADVIARPVDLPVLLHRVRQELERRRASGPRRAS